MTARLRGLVLVLLACASSSPAQDPETAPYASESGDLQSRVESLEEELARLQRQLPAEGSEPHRVGDEVVKIRGRIQADAIMVDQTERNKEIFGDVENAFGFRRARLGAEGYAWDQGRWVAEFDFASGSITFADVFVAAEQLPMLAWLRFGYFREPFSLEALTSSNDLPFLERSPINPLDPGRKWGVGAHHVAPNERWTLTAGIFRSGTNAAGTDVGDGNDMQYTARLTALPWRDSEEDGARLVHVGAAFSQLFPKDDVYTINQGPQSSLLQTGDTSTAPFVPKISFPASQVQLYNLQAAAVWGPVSLEAEWSGSYADQIGGGPVFLQGCYVFGSYFLTGEHRHYLPREGFFGRTNVHAPFVCLPGTTDAQRGWGAWELTARFAYVNFESPNIPASPQGLAVGNRLAEGTFGVNWYWNDCTRLMFNYLRVVPVDPNFGPSGADAFFIRAAVCW